MMWFTIIRERRLTRLLERLREVEERVVSLEFEMAEVVDKTKRWMWRAVKREEVDEGKQADKPNGTLPPRSQRINDDILRRRAAAPTIPKLPTEE